MAGPKRSGGRPAFSSAKPSGSRSKASNVSRNVSGYQRRQEKKAKSTLQPASDDLYEYAPGKNKRARVELKVDREELVGETSSKHRGLDDDADDVDSDVEALRRKIAANMEGDFGVVDSEDDEDIDSDEAFEGESDEERFANFKFADSKKSSKSKRRDPPNRAPLGTLPDVNLNEDEDEEMEDGDEDAEDEDDEDEDDVDDDEGVSLSAMLEDGAAASVSGSESNNEGDDDDNDDDEDEEDEDEDEEEDADEDEADVLALSDDESQGDDALEKLDRFIDDLTPLQKRKASKLEEDTAASNTRKRKRRTLTELTEAGAESEFAARAMGDSKLSLDDLLQPLSGTKTVSLDKAARALASTKVDTLAAPLPTRAQEKIDRQAAYDATKVEVEKWAPTMKRIREAEHLSFPLQKAPISQPSISELSGNFKPSNELESAVDRLLKSAKLRESDIEQTEDLEMAHLTKEEVAARRAELRHARELMFRADAKAKRIAKIKSKTYRKIQKKAREKNALSLDEVANLDPEAAEAERLKLEMERAKERATMRHKNTGKWAKQMMARGKDLDVDQRRELNAQLERGEQLRRKIQGLDSDGEAPDSDSDPEQDVEDITGRAFEELAAEGADTSGLPASSGKKKKAGILDMKFMREAAAREDRAAQADADDFRAELLGLTGGAEGTTPANEEPSNSMLVQGNSGRMIFRPTADDPSSSRGPASQRVPHPPPSDASSTTLKSSHDDSPQIKPSALQQTTPLALPPSISNSVTTKAVENPWLTVGSSTAKLSRKRNETLVSKDSGADAKSQAALKKQLARSQDALDREADDALVEIDVDVEAGFIPAPAEPEPAPKANAGKSKAKGKKKATVVDGAYQDSDDEMDEDAPAQGSNGVKAFKQRDLVALAFAGDNVIEEFNARKQREIEAAAPKEIDMTLAGWGSWGGKGTKKSKRAPHPSLIKKVPGIAPTARADAGKAHLIISEKKDKKASKYLVRDLPHPYTSRAQFEKSLDTPVGPEWNTRTSFQKGTLPRVVKKMGTIIDPVQQRF
ncbi:Utp14-domain-containing protein [Clavulina sp. PMI_390]|nr:Utp14-domain-containing protein [Clavulina sp. PMI_390]